MQRVKWPLPLPLLWQRGRLALRPLPSLPKQILYYFELIIDYCRFFPLPDSCRCMQMQGMYIACACTGRAPAYIACGRVCILKPGACMQRASMAPAPCMHTPYPLHFSSKGRGRETLVARGFSRFRCTMPYYSQGIQSSLLVQHP